MLGGWWRHRWSRLCGERRVMPLTPHQSPTTAHHTTHHTHLTSVSVKTLSGPASNRSSDSARSSHRRGAGPPVADAGSVCCGVGLWGGGDDGMEWAGPTHTRRSIERASADPPRPANAHAGTDGRTYLPCCPVFSTAVASIPWPFAAAPRYRCLLALPLGYRS